MISRLLKDKIGKRSEDSHNKEYDHYSDKYWNELQAVQEYINKIITGNKDIIWQVDILTRFKKYIPFKNVLIIGCGNGWVERQLFDLGIAKHFDAFDYSDRYLRIAKNAVGGRDITYFWDDLNNLQNIPENRYNAIFNVGASHHVSRLSRSLWILYKSLESNGLMFNVDYIGPAQNQYSDGHLKIMEEINNKLPKRFRTKYPLRPSKENFKHGDPTEAVNSDLVRPVFKRFFKTIYEKEFNGGIVYQILWNNIDEFNKGDEEANKILHWLLEQDKKFSESKKIPSLFWYSVGAPKPKHKIVNWDTLPP